MSTRRHDKAAAVAVTCKHMLLFGSKTRMVAPEDALPGRPDPDPRPRAPLRARNPAQAPVPRRPADRRRSAWAASGAPSACSGRRTGVYTTAVGYAGGYTPNPTYEETCSGKTGHTEAVLVVFDPGQDQLRGAPEALLGEPRPDPGHAPGQRRGHPVPLGRSTPRAPSRSRRSRPPGRRSASA